MRRRHVRGSKGPLTILLLIAVFGTAAILLGRFIQANFMGAVKSEIGLHQEQAPLPPNMARQQPQM